MCSACMTIAPSGSNSAQEASRRSLMFAECEARTSTAPISSHAARSAPVATLSVTGSMSEPLRLLQSHGAGVEHLAAPPLGHGERRLRQLDDRRAGDLLAGRGLTADHLRVAEQRLSARALGAGRRPADGGGVDVRARLGGCGAQSNKL